MGGRGSAGNRTRGSKEPLKGKKKSLFSKKAAAEKPEEKTAKKAAKKEPLTGKKVQQDYIGYVKYQIGVDLTKARANIFDNRNGFTIDTRKLSRNQWNDLQSLARQYKGGGSFEVAFENNGAHLMFISIKRRKR